MGKLRTLLRDFVPARWREAWRRRFGWRWFHGDYATWAEARRASAGYEEAAGIERVIAAARHVRAGRAAWDRDGATFAKAESHEPLLRALRTVRPAGGPQLHVVDFGGALGSTWRQHRSALAGVVASWRVVEQPALVAAGRAEFAIEPLSFHGSLAEACAAGPVDVILLSSVLPYLEAPHALLGQIAGLRIPHVILDRTPFIAGGRDRLVVQRTPRALGGGSYPCWLFDRAGLVRDLAGTYTVVDDWEVLFDRVDPAVRYGGLHFALRATGEIRAASPAC